MKCIETYLEAVKPCSFPEEIKLHGAAYRIFSKMNDLYCANDSFFEKMKGDQCLIDSRDQIKTCIQKSSFEIVKKFAVKFIENEKFEWKMNADDCT